MEVVVVEWWSSGGGAGGGGIVVEELVVVMWWWRSGGDGGSGGGGDGVVMVVVVIVKWWRLVAYFSWLDFSYCIIIIFVLACYIMDDSSIDPGPTDGSLLVLQKQHRSRAVWEGYGNPKVENVTLICRRNDSNLRQLGRPSPRIVQLIYQAGFGGILEMPFITLDRAFITALIERWRPETHTFHLHSGESTVTLQDVEIITGLAVDGRPVTGYTRFDQNKKKNYASVY
ncbi:hypothetical protein RHGRI_024125 [Rhododendron griersonianum]|uniref:Aminotransferase-like plant mobile domain-containing protein n=1 Tax=Rhododendron griersonianum TaxID=479676 RepID=A0AAV6JAN9_9ERIC|nr:hypothetical protein RHGRI_024125 [Rhododendron griersonianum]